MTNDLWYSVMSSGAVGKLLHAPKDEFERICDALTGEIKAAGHKQIHAEEIVWEVLRL